MPPATKASRLPPASAQALDSFNAQSGVLMIAKRQADQTILDLWSQLSRAFENVPSLPTRTPSEQTAIFSPWPWSSSKVKSIRLQRERAQSLSTVSKPSCPAGVSQPPSSAPSLAPTPPHRGKSFAPSTIYGYCSQVQAGPSLPCEAYKIVLSCRLEQHVANTLLVSAVAHGAWPTKPNPKNSVKASNNGDETRDGDSDHNVDGDDSGVDHQPLSARDKTFDAPGAGQNSVSQSYDGSDQGCDAIGRSQGAYVLDLGADVGLSTVVEEPEALPPTSPLQSRPPLEPPSCQGPDRGSPVEPY
ncbi:hypothetical protein LY76DRAFT_609278 [Colletotrichum caudatum]|nr:hypothetical protein LY76DRAFT_609278 [Colletotrichum caudatum]